MQTYRQGDQIGDRRQGDVALAEVELEFDLAVAVLEHFAFRLDGGGVGTGGGFGQTKAGNEFAVGQFRQVILLLFIGAVVAQQLRRTQ